MKTKLTVACLVLVVAGGLFLRAAESGAAARPGADPAILRGLERYCPSLLLVVDEVRDELGEVGADVGGGGGDVLEPLDRLDVALAARATHGGEMVADGQPGRHFEVALEVLADEVEDPLVGRLNPLEPGRVDLLEVLDEVLRRDAAEVDDGS